MFLRVESSSLLKTIWEKKNCLIDFNCFLICIFSDKQPDDSKRSLDRHAQLDLDKPQADMQLGAHKHEHNQGHREFKYGDGFRRFIDENGYKGGATGVLLGNRLGFAEGHGRSITGHNIHKQTPLPASGLSKIITSMTILKLMEEGLVHPESRIFGKDGILKTLTPKHEELTDKRILDITVNDLLHHAGGWDSEISRVADPVFNEFLVEGNHLIVNITLALNLSHPLTVHDIIKFMAKQRLDFEPGTASRVSNFGYLLLGRVIEEVTEGQPYETVVRHKVLEKCGMWHTRLGPHIRDNQEIFKSRSTREIKAELLQRHETIGEYYAYAQTYLVDSCLGWFTNVYDVMRLAQCIDGSADYQLLNKTTLSYMTHGEHRNSDYWYAVGFLTNKEGELWVGDEPHAPEVLFFHRNIRRSLNYEDKNEPVAWTFLFEGEPSYNAPLKHMMSRALVEAEYFWPEEDAYIEDVADKLLTLGTTTKLIKLKIDEHRGNAYLSALKQAQFNLIWINAYTNDGNTFFSVIGEKDIKASRECVALVGLDREQLVRRKLEIQKQGYNMTFFQNYKSFSHIDRYMYLAAFHKGAFPNDSHILYGIQHFDRPYKTLLQLYEEKGYRPLVQSVEYDRDDTLLSFILEADTSDEKDQKPIFSNEVDLSEARLEKFVRRYARDQRRLIYLDASNHRGKPKFSALFKKTRMTKWLFSQGLSEQDLITVITEKQQEGYLPSIIVGYSTKSGDLKFVTYMEKP